MIVEREVDVEADVEEAAAPATAVPAVAAPAAGRHVSIVIPVHDEGPNIEPLVREIDAVARAEGYRLEVLFVDDGSRDDTWAAIGRVAAADARVQGIRFRRNFGKAAALSAGFEAARGEFVVTLDGDLQDDPGEIPRLLAEIDKGYDLVSGWKRVRHDPWHKVGPSRVFNWLVSRLTGVRLHDHNCGVKCYRADVLREVDVYGELHRFIPVLAAARGWRVGELEVNHRPRTAGRSKYGVSRFLKGFLDLLTVLFLTGYGQRPLHFLGTIGLGFFAVGGLGLTYLFGYWVARQWFGDASWAPLHQRPAVIYAAAALLLGAQMVGLGFLAELVTAHTRRDAKPYSVMARTPARATASSTTHETNGIE